MVLCQRGDRGPIVADLRGKLVRLSLLADDGADEFDQATDLAVRDFQQQRGLRVDGLVGPQTYRALDEAHWRLGDRLLSHVVGHPYIGDDVVALQHRLLEFGFNPGRSDGIFGASTEAALREFQRGVGLPPDGTVGPSTLAALGRLSRTVTGGSPSALREEERLRRPDIGVGGRIIAIDPGHGGQDAGYRRGELTEADLTLDLAQRLEGRLGVLGLRTHLTRGADSCPDDSQRAQLANDVNADLVVSLHIDSHESPLANGIATAYYGAHVRGRDIYSAMGKRLAALTQSELVARTDLLDCRIHAKAWELLRLTRMPAIRVDVGYLTNPDDARRLAAPEFRDTVAEAVAMAVQRLYLPEYLDIPTGQFHLSGVAS